MKNISFHSEVLMKNINFECENVSLPEIYRSYRTILPPVDTFSDLSDDQNEQEIVRSFTDAFSGIDLTLEVTNRPFQYANAFSEIKEDDFFRGFVQNGIAGNYPIGRFGDGMNYGVLYSALDKDTSESEAIYYAVKEFLDRLKDLKEESLIVDRKMVAFDFVGALMDLTKCSEAFSNLISDDYSFCREIGFEYFKIVDAFKTPSARKENGICFSIFEKNSIKNFNQKNSFRYNFRITIFKKNPEEIIIENFSTRVIETSAFLRPLS